MEEARDALENLSGGLACLTMVIGKLCGVGGKLRLMRLHDFAERDACNHACDQDGMRLMEEEEDGWMLQYAGSVKFDI